MELEIRVWLYDILNAIAEIDGFFIALPMDFKIYQSDIRTRRAVERNIEIIGEAINRILKKDSLIEIQHSRKIVDTRNRIIHGYDAVSNELIWGIVVNHLPELRRQIEQLLGENGEITN